MIAMEKVVHELKTVLHNDATLESFFIPAGIVLCHTFVDLYCKT